MDVKLIVKRSTAELVESRAIEFCLACRDIHKTQSVTLSDGDTSVFFAAAFWGLLCARDVHVRELRNPPCGALRLLTVLAISKDEAPSSSTAVGSGYVCSSGKVS